MILRLGLGALFLACPIPGLAQEPPCDRTAIQWILPGDFETARARAVEENRLLVIKGISFGVDEAGAKCATKGTW